LRRPQSAPRVKKFQRLLAHPGAVTAKRRQLHCHRLLVILCERHDRLTGNINFQDNLLNVLLTRSLPWEMSAPAP
jgi:hypothetical protein